MFRFGLATAMVLTGCMHGIKPDRVLVGDWVSRTEKGCTEEHWNGEDARGTSVTFDASGAEKERETMRLEQRGGDLFLVAYPSGQRMAEFVLTKADPTTLVFENPDHDYPTRIAYQRRGEKLVAEISGPDGHMRRTWEYVPGSGCTNPTSAK